MVELLLWALTLIPRRSSTWDNKNPYMRRDDGDGYWLEL